MQIDFTWMCQNCDATNVENSEVLYNILEFNEVMRCGACGYGYSVGWQSKAWTQITPCPHSVNGRCAHVHHVCDGMNAECEVHPDYGEVS